ncbi:MAG: U32 family peptidase [Nanoarchaeota archaeon]
MVNNHKIELLCPAGSLPKLKAAVAGGADAVYLGMSKFNAREFAKNFDEDYLKEAVAICKSNNVKLYLTANTLIKNSEVQEFIDMIKYAYECGIDAVIIQDPSFISIIRSNFPGLHIHMSTQAGVMNSEHANLFSSIDRINLARELNKKNIESIRKNFKKELEVFIHGALCACVSGSCLFSSLLGGRSGNRGKCAQPCRKLYNNSFMLSTKELCLIDRLPELLNMNIESLKIEGRMRSPFYAYTTANIYRNAIDSFYSGKFNVTSEMKKELENAFSREFTEGKFADKFVFNPKQASGTSSIRKNIYEVPIRNVGILKRKGSNKLPQIKSKESEKKHMIVRIYNEKDALVADKYADIICLDMFDKDFEKIKAKLTKPLYAVTPRIMFDSDLDKITERIKQITPDGLIAGNMGIINMKFNLPIILDYNSNCFNDIQLNYYQSLNTKPIMSPELSLSQLEEFKNKDFIVFVHGKIRLMTLAHNLAENKMQDEKGFIFFQKLIFNGAEIINGKELGLFNKIRPLIKRGINQIYLDTESTKDASLEEILEVYGQILAGKTPDASMLQKHFNLGWSKLGVE